MNLMETVMTFRRIKLLSAHIRADEHDGFYVEFEHHHPDVVDAEYIWIVLQYIARVLFDQVKQDPFSAVVLRQAICVALAEGLDDKMDIFAAAELDDVARMRDSSPTQIAWKGRCTLYFISCTRRGSWIMFPRACTTQQGVYSALAVLQASCRHLGEDRRRLLKAALTGMLIESGDVDWTQASALVNMPRAAYLGACLAA